MQPDLRFISLNAIVTDPSVEAGIKNYRVAVQFTVRNEGKTAVPADNVTIPLIRSPRPVYFVQIVANAAGSGKQNNTAYTIILL